VTHVAAIYAKETGHGMAFEVVLPLPQPQDADGEAPDIPRLPTQPSGVSNVMRPGAGEIKLIHQSPPDTTERPGRSSDRPTRLASSRNGRTAPRANLRDVDRPDDQEAGSGTDKVTNRGTHKDTDKGVDKGPDNGPNKGPGGPPKGKPRLKIVK